jgi:hypothetical protein
MYVLMYKIRHTSNLVRPPPLSAPPSPVSHARAPPSAAGCRRAGDGGGAEGDDALVSPVTGSAPPSPVMRARALLPRQLVAWFVRVCLGCARYVGSGR